MFVSPTRLLIKISEQKAIVKGGLPRRALGVRSGSPGCFAGRPELVDRVGADRDGVSRLRDGQQRPLAFQLVR